MDFPSLILKINALLSLSSIAVYLLHKIGSRPFFKFSYLYRLQISYLLVILSIALPVVVPYLSIHINSGSVRLEDIKTGEEEISWKVAVSKAQNLFMADPQVVAAVSKVLSVIAFSGAIIFLFQIIGLSFKTSKLRTFKKLGSVHLAIQPDKTSPYVFSLMNQKYIVLPAFLMADKKLLNMAIKHELQHIRQQDTRWIYLLNLVLLGCYVNPLVHLLIRNIKNTQELACDEELIINKKVKFKSYIQSLLKIAELVQERKSAPFFANTILREGNKSNLRERVEMMIKVRKNKNKGYMAGIVLFAAFFMMGGSAYAVKDLKSEVRAKAILFDIVQMEEGKVVSRPKVISLEGEPALIMTSDEAGNGMALSILAYAYGDRVEMRIESTVTTRHIVGKTEVFNVEIRSGVRWSMDYQQSGKNLSLEVTPTFSKSRDR